MNHFQEFKLVILEPRWACKQLTMGFSCSINSASQERTSYQDTFMLTKKGILRLEEICVHYILVWFVLGLQLQVVVYRQLEHQPYFLFVMLCVEDNSRLLKAVIRSAS